MIFPSNLAEQRSSQLQHLLGLLTFLIHFLIIEGMADDYFVYAPDNRLSAAWGCSAISAGYTRIAPGSPYPPARHPDDHHFSWTRGRTLRAFQIILISQGYGTLEFGPDRRAVRLRPGDTFLLCPGLWHRYAPDPETGWTEHWIECRGSAFQFTLDTGMLPTDHPVRSDVSGVEEVFGQIHALARSDMLVNQPILSTLGLQLLARFCRSAEQVAGNTHIVDRVRLILMERCTAPLVPEDIAREAGVSYSHLRRLFRKEMGMSLKDYQIKARIQRACDLLDNSDKSVKEVAGLLGFGSAFHFSTQFRTITGMPPSGWRTRSAERDWPIITSSKTL